MESIIEHLRKGKALMRSIEIQLEIPSRRPFPPAVLVDPDLSRFFPRLGYREDTGG